MKNDMRDIIDSTMLPPEVKKRLDEKAAATSAKTKLLGRFVARAPTIMTRTTLMPSGISTVCGRIMTLLMRIWFSIPTEPVTGNR